ncbi:hypothetical protein [Streptomyces sp. NPDC054838]
MSNNDPVNPAEVPVFTGDLAVLDAKVKALSGDGGALANAGTSVHTTFGGLSAYYKAPEAEQLFAVTKPVADITMSFSGDMCTIAGALGSYANEIRPLVKRLETLKAEAASFKAKVSGDEDWIEDGDLIDENLDRRNKIGEVWSQFQAAERTAHDKIVALVCGVPLKVDDGSHGANMYGYDAEALKNSKSLPWGDAVQESVPWWQVWEHAYDFGKGVIVDGVWGTIKGLGTLVGFDGWDATKQAWTGLAKLSTGIAITLTPGAAGLFWTADDKDLPGWIRDSRTAMKETGKALLAWDQWSENPSRAAGAVTFNVVTAIFTDGAGAGASGAGKAGAAAKALSFAGKAGRAIDPMTYVFKGAGAGLSKIGDVMAGLKGIGKIEIPKISEGAFALPDGASMLPDGTIHLPSGAAIPEGAIKLPDGGIKLPEGTATLPPGTVKLPFDDSPAKYIDNEGNLYKEDGSLFQHAKDAKVEPAPAAAHAPKVESPVLVGVGARGGDDVIRLGSDMSDPVHVGDHTPTGHAGDHAPAGHAPDGMPRNSHETPGGGGGDTPHSHDATPTGGHTDGPSHGSHSDTTSGGHGEGPGGDAYSDGLGGGHGGGPAGGGLEGPRGDLPDGSWAGENGLRLDHEANSAADDFMRRSAEAEPRITESMQDIAGKLDDGKLLGLEYRLKGEDSLKRKLATDMLEDAGLTHGEALGGIRDSIRYTMEVPHADYTHGVQQAVDELQAKGYENVKFKNSWSSSGYKGINSTWRDPVSGQVFEVQFHTAESFAAKMDTHVLYERGRLPGNSPDELAALQAAQDEIFDNVPVPHDAGSIRLAGHGVEDAVTALGRDADVAADHLPSVADDFGEAGGDSAHHADDPRAAGDDPTSGAGEAEHPYTHGPDGGWSGAGWVEKPGAYEASVYESLRATPNHIDVPAMARTTGIDESVIRQVKTHMIRAQHDVVVGPGEWRRGRFTPRDDIARLWDGARKGTLNEAQITEFRHLMTHEYVESQLMKAGLPYLHDQGGLWRREDGGGRYSPKSLSAAGAHDLAPNPVRGGFGTAWQKIGLKHPRTVLAPDLSNIDEFVKDIFQELRAKGLNLK